MSHDAQSILDHAPRAVLAGSRAARDRTLRHYPTGDRMIARRTGQTGDRCLLLWQADADTSPSILGRARRKTRRGVAAWHVADHLNADVGQFGELAVGADVLRDRVVEPLIREHRRALLREGVEASRARSAADGAAAIGELLAGGGQPRPAPSRPPRTVTVVDDAAPMPPAAWATYGRPPWATDPAGPAPAGGSPAS